jgi:hypothetical protein
MTHEPVYYDPEYYDALAIRLHQAMQSVFVRWGAEMYSHRWHDMRPISIPKRWFENYSVNVMRGPRWNGEVYFRLAALVYRAGVQSARLDELVERLRTARLARDVYGWTYGLRLNFLDASLAWHPCVPCLDAALSEWESVLSCHRRAWIRPLRLRTLPSTQRSCPAELMRSQQVRAALEHRCWKGNPRSPVLARVLARSEGLFLEARGLIEKLAEVDHQRAHIPDLVDLCVLLVDLERAMQGVMGCGAEMRAEVFRGLAWEQRKQGR